MRYGVRGNEQEGMVGGMYIGEDDDYEELISGDDDDDDTLESLSVGDSYGDPEIVGALRTLKRKGGKKLGALGKSILARNAGMVINRQLNIRRRYPSGFDSATVGPGGIATVTSNPQNLLRCERLVIPSVIALFFQIRDTKVGNTSQFVQSLPVPADMFSEVAIDTNVWFDTAKVGNEISLEVQNIDAVPHDFRAGMIGSIAKA